MKTAFRAWGVPQAFATSTRLVIRRKYYLAKEKMLLNLHQKLPRITDTYEPHALYVPTTNMYLSSPSSPTELRTGETPVYGPEPRSILNNLKHMPSPPHNKHNSGAAAYQLGNTSSRTITEVKQR